MSCPLYPVSFVVLVFSVGEDLPEYILLAVLAEELPVPVVTEAPMADLRTDVAPG
jgi:hypothetical protein